MHGLAKFEMPKQFPSATRGLGVAAKIMSNMGYREGSGLGRDEQGMSTALRVEKTGRTALIIGEQNRWKQEPGTLQDSADMNLRRV